MNETAIIIAITGTIDDAIAAWVIARKYGDVAGAASAITDIKQLCLL